jgi:hypothetical protein
MNRKTPSHLLFATSLSVLTGFFSVVVSANDYKQLNIELLGFKELKFGMLSSNVIPLGMECYKSFIGQPLVFCESKARSEDGYLPTFLGFNLKRGNPEYSIDKGVSGSFSQSKQHPTKSDVKFLFEEIDAILESPDTEEIKKERLGRLLHVTGFEGRWNKYYRLYKAKGFEAVEVDKISGGYFLDEISITVDTSDPVLSTGIRKTFGEPTHQKKWTTDGGKVGHTDYWLFANDAVLAHNWIEDDRTALPRVIFFSPDVSKKYLESAFPEVRLKQLDKKDY